MLHYLNFAAHEVAVLKWKSGPDMSCITSHLTRDIYSCHDKAIGCRYAMPFGNDVFCQHPDRKQFSTRQAHDVLPAAANEPVSKDTEE